MIADKALQYRYGQPLPTVNYTQSELQTWSTVYERLRAASRQHAVDEYTKTVDEMERKSVFGVNRIPQMQEVSDFLEARTGWTLRPAAGLLPARGFLNGLALRVFHSTQYVRHGSRPFYTPEPDIVHELRPLLAGRGLAAPGQVRRRDRPLEGPPPRRGPSRERGSTIRWLSRAQPSDG